MKMKLKVFVVLDSIILAAAIVVGCVFSSNYFNSNLKPKFYQVSFNTKGGNKLPSVQVLQGTRVEKPEDPVKEGYVFLTWIYNYKEWNFSFQVVNENMTLTAEWGLLQ